jgi:eukaryotic-like serine/threonine-protein kinase
VKVQDIWDLVREIDAMHIGQVLAERFALERLAGRGGMGVVYRAQDRSTGQPVALKVLHGQGGDAARFEREARILAELDHPLVVRYVAHGALPSGEPYLAMEWLEGEDLAERLARERPGLAESVALAVQVAEALAALHQRGIVHRDLKPSNVFLVDGRLDGIKLLDFGLARMETTTRMTDAGTLLGTVAYMAPEQARGSDGLDARADVFALGCLLFECLTGQTPFAAVHATAVLTKILFEDTPRLGQRLPGAPEALEGLLQRMLAKQPHQRPRDGRAATEALRALGSPRLEPVPLADTVELPRTPAITDSEQRAVAVILIAPARAVPETHVPPAEMQRREDVDVDALDAAATEHGGRLQRLLDGAAAVLLSGTHVATDLAAQAARCALALGRHAPGRRLALAIGRSASAGPQPVGPAIDLAARLLDIEPALEQDAQRALIVLDDATVGLLDARFDVRDHSGIVVLTGERDGGEVRTLLGKPTPCVGRERELRMLAGLLEDCVEHGGAQAALVTAPPGTGKSRLAQELLQHVRDSGKPVAIWIARGDSLRAGSAFGLLGQALRGAWGVRDGEPLDVRRDKVRACVASRVAESQRQRVTEFLGEIIGTPFPDENSLPLRAARGDAQLMSEQMRDAFLDFLVAECTRHPVIIVLEDLHWGDRPTVQFLDRALRDLGDQSLFVLALARPEVHEVFPQLWAERPLQEIRLKELPRKAIERLVRHVLEDKALPETIDTLARLSEGNAFYLEELIRWAAEGRDEELPRTVVAMVQSRLGALDDVTRRLLRAASVFGEVFWAEGIAALLGGTNRALMVRDWLAGLLDRELLARRKDSRFPDQEEYAFRHALLREGAYAMLTDEDRALGHQLAAEWLEMHGEPDALLLAEHFEKGGEGERAGRYYLRAAEQAHAAGDSPVAISYARRGLACAISGELRIALLGTLCEMNFWQNTIATALPFATELVQVAGRGCGPWVRGSLIVLTCSMEAGRIDEFMAILHDLLETEPSPDAAITLTLSIAAGVHLLDVLARIQEGDAVMARLAAIVRIIGDRVPSVPMVWHIISTSRLAYRGDDPASGLAHGKAAVAIADAIGHRRYRLLGQLTLALVWWTLGAHEETEGILREMSVPDEELGYASSGRPFVLAWFLADRGALDEARTWASRLVMSATSLRLRPEEGRGHWVLAEVLRRVGELEAAEAEIQAARPLVDTASPLDLPGVLATLAALRLAQGRVAEALTAADEGMAKYETIGACSQFCRGGFLRLVHAECLEATGDHDAAKAAIARARDRLFVIAGKIGDPVYRKSFLENVPENRRTLELARQWLDAEP